MTSDFSQIDFTRQISAYFWIVKARIYDIATLFSKKQIPLFLSSILMNNQKYNFVDEEFIYMFHY